ncbi:gliding motility-associated C-terminal domain-containing protein [bacterium]|nr:gliding motility-associated C-terminal domain-containing protein [bacterium]
MKQLKISIILTGYLLCNSGGFCGSNDIMPVLSIPRVTVAPVIDGIRDPVWNYTGLQMLTHDIGQYTWGCPGWPPDSPEDCNPGFRALWDSECLYFYFTVDDDTLIRNLISTGAFEDDNFELFIDADYSHTTEYDGEDDFRLDFPWRDEAAYLGNALPSKINIDHLILSENETSTGWDLELAMPLEDINMPATDGHIFGLDVHYDDDDGHNLCGNENFREHKLAWWAEGSDDSWQRPILFAKVTLGPLISPADIELSAPGHDFGNVHVDQTGTFDLAVSNPGIDTLRISDIRSGSAVFTADPRILEIAPGQNDEITVQFHPGETVLCSDTLYIVSNAFGKPVIQFWVHGTGIYPKVETVTVFPNPFTPNGDGYNDAVCFEYPDMFTVYPHIQIFDLKGSRIRDMARFPGPEYQWDGKDDQGKNLVPGVYIYVLELNDRTLSKGTITLIR